MALIKKQRAGKMAVSKDHSLNRSRYPTRRNRTEPVKPTTSPPTKKKLMADGDEPGDEPDDDAMDIDNASESAVRPTDLDAGASSLMTQLKSFGFGLSKLMSLVSKGPNTSGDEPMVPLGEESVTIRSRQTSSEELSASDGESIAESTAAPSPSIQRPRFAGYLDQSLRHEKMNKNGIYRPRGRTMTDENGAKFWRDSDDEPWTPAVYHYDLRAQMIEDCAKKGQYKYPRLRGKHPLDVTAFLPAQKDWGFERHQRPDILHQYEKKGRQNPTYPVQVWTHNGAVVLDFENIPILDFKNMPATISSLVEGGLQEAIIREDLRIDAKDFRVRMLADPKERGMLSLPGLSAISMRRSRFRWRAGYLSWTPRTGSEDIKRYLDEILPENLKAMNTTKGFRELRPSEVKLMAALNRGKHLKRAGPRALTPVQRMAMDKSFYRSIHHAIEREKLEQGYNENKNNTEIRGEAFERVTQMMAKDQGQEKVDYRFVSPVDEVEEKIVAEAIDPALRQFCTLTGEDPDIPKNWDYASRWNALQTHLYHFWLKKGWAFPLPTMDQCRDPWYEGYPLENFSSSS